MPFFVSSRANNPQLKAGSATAGYRPPQWGKQKQSTLITVRNTNSTAPKQSGVSGDSTTSYFFDAVIRAEHSQEMNVTPHPVQSSASIVDHAYLMSARLVLEIGMSDVLQSFVSGAYTSNKSKSVSAYQTFIAIQELRIPITVTTRLRIYNNMVIRSINASDTRETQHGLKASIHFEEIIVAEVTQNTVSARPNQTAINNLGTVQPEPVPPELLKYLNPKGSWNSNTANLPPSN